MVSLLLQALLLLKGPVWRAEYMQPAPCILQKWACGFRVYSLQLIVQMCGQWSVLFSGPVSKVFKTMNLRKKNSGTLT